jgi:hypothetical protein
VKDAPVGYKSSRRSTRKAASRRRGRSGHGSRVGDVELAGGWRELEGDVVASHQLGGLEAEGLVLTGDRSEVTGQSHAHTSPGLCRNLRDVAQEKPAVAQTAMLHVGHPPGLPSAARRKTTPSLQPILEEKGKGASLWRICGGQTAHSTYDHL